VPGEAHGTREPSARGRERDRGWRAGAAGGRGGRARRAGAAGAHRPREALQYPWHRPYQARTAWMPLSCRWSASADNPSAGPAGGPGRNDIIADRCTPDQGCSDPRSLLRPGGSPQPSRPPRGNRQRRPGRSLTAGNPSIRGAATRDHGCGDSCGT